MSADEGAAPARRGASGFRKAQAVRFAPEQARRQGEITRLAFLLLGREAAIAFLNTANAELRGRPLDLATASDDGRNRVEAAIGRLAYTAPGGGGRPAPRDPAAAHFRLLGEPAAAPGGDEPPPSGRRMPR